MQNAAFRALGLDFAYVPFKVTREELRVAIAGMRALNIRGLNITIPHKVAVLPFLDSVDPLAKKIGAVNTIVSNGTTLTGYNTDAGGFIQPLLERGFELRDSRVLVIGAGGAARAVAFALIEGGARVVVLNRTPDRAHELARHLSQHTPGRAEGGELNNDNLFEAMSNTVLVVNTTSVGMGTPEGQSPIPSAFLRRDILVYDIVYNPLKTRLISEAQAAGCRTIAGAEMLAWQGALAFERFTGIKAPIELMKQQVVRSLTE